MFDRILVANRGEIAVRIIRACRELGIESVVVYSTEDAHSEAVRLADQAIAIGPPPAAGSYLLASAIIEAARITGCQAIHPGYGFLSEDPDFAQICTDNDLIFIGPPPELMAQLGDKATARALMHGAGLPLLPGSSSTVDSVRAAERILRDVGYPVIIKAAAGGGGRGMEVVWAREQLAETMIRTQRTAQSVFGDPRVYLERYCTAARHVEIQILADKHGNAIHLGERDCSIQRRHQKLIEESPAPGLDRALMEAMAQASVEAVRRIGYVGAGTLEFLVDDQGFYFMEINCRVQVEHAVTEAITGVDIVQEQILVAGGLPLSINQAHVQTSGVAMECRVNAEDPMRDFAPTPGWLDQFVPPGGPFVRVDTAARSGWAMSSYYDSLLAKIVVWAPTRGQAISRMDRCLHETLVEGRGVATTIPVLRQILAAPAFAEARHDTRWLENHSQNGAA